MSGGPWDDSVFFVVIISGGAGSGLFVYSPTVGPGNLVGSWAGVGGTDAFGNTYPAGFSTGVAGVGQTQIDNAGNVGLVAADGNNLIRLNPNASRQVFYSDPPGLGSVLVSIAAKNSTDAFGNAIPQGIQINKGVFNGSNFLFNTQGFFFYSGTPGLGNLIASVAPAAGTDPHGNAFLAGFSTYDNSLGSPIGVNILSGAIELNANTLGFAPATLTPSSLQGVSDSGTDTPIVLGFIPASVALGGVPQLIVSAPGYTAVTGSQLEVAGGIAVGGIIRKIVGGAAETQHPINWPAGITTTQSEYYLSDEGRLYIDLEMSAEPATANNYTATTTLPAAYQPNNEQRIPVALNGAIGSPSAPRLRISTGGLIQITGLPSAAYNNTISAHGSVSLFA